MALTPGTRLGPYEVTAQIGVGGMGEVYRATDTKLKREVAVKVLPSALAADPERLARVWKEARPVRPQPADYKVDNPAVFTRAVRRICRVQAARRIRIRSAAARPRNREDSMPSPEPMQNGELNLNTN